MGRAAVVGSAALTVSLLLGPPAGARAAPGDPPRWRLAPGALAEYSLFPVDASTPLAAPGTPVERKRGAEKPWGVFGHRVVGGRSPQPLQPDVPDLGRIVALTLPADAAGGKESILFPAVGDCGPVEVEGTWTGRPRDDGRIEFRATAELRHRGPPKSPDFTRVLVGGHVEALGVFDPARGVIAEASWDLKARTVPDEGPAKDRKPSEVRDSGDLVLRGVKDAKGPDFQKDVDAAIAKGVEWLGKQPKDGVYPPYEGFPGGIDGLAALALYACDDERKAGDAALARAMRLEPDRTYQVAVGILAIDMRHTPPGEAALLRSGKIAKPVRVLTEAERAWVQKGADRILRSAEAPGRWSYPSAHGGRILPSPPDLSNTQYAVLGLLAARRCGIPIEDGAWIATLRAHLQIQEKDGPAVPGWFPSYRQQRAADGGVSLPTAPSARARGFSYRSGEPAKGTMTCAGIASVAICRDVLAESGGSPLPPELVAASERAVADGFGWLQSHYSVEQAPRARGRPENWLHYYLYALERAGILSDVVRVNEHDWYGDGALHLLLTQDAEGWWTEEPGSVPRKLADTCFALLFLKRAVTPVATK